MSVQKSYKKLPNAPLQEVIFEVRWDLSVNEQTNQSYDEGFAFAPGKLQSLVKKEFPFTKRKLPAEIPPEALIYQTIHQFWHGQNEWPALQLGPGIFTVNDTEKKYIWEDSFYPLIQKSLKWLYEAYDQALTIRYCNLKYIDVIRLKDYLNSKDIVAFVEKNLHIGIVNKIEMLKSPDHCNITQTFVQDDKSELHIAVADGQDERTKERILMWHTAVSKKEHFTEKDVILWCKQAHDIVSPLFREMTKGVLYDSFTKSSV